MDPLQSDEMPRITLKVSSSVASGLSIRSGTVPASPMSFEYQRMRIMQDMINIQTRLVGEQKAVESTLMVNVEKDDTLATMSEALQEQKDAQALELRVITDVQRSEAAHLQFAVDVLRQDLQMLQTQMERNGQMQVDNQELQQQVHDLLERADGLDRYYAVSTTRMNSELKRVRYDVEERFRKAVMQYKKLYKRAAYDALSDHDKLQLMENGLLQEELALQHVGLDNLRYRYEQLTEERKRLMAEIAAFHKNSVGHAKRISELRRAHSCINARTEDVAACYGRILKEHRSLTQKDLVFLNGKLKNEIKTYDHRRQHAEQMSQKWKTRLREVKKLSIDSITSQSRSPTTRKNKRSPCSPSSRPLSAPCVNPELMRSMADLRHLEDARDAPGAFMSLHNRLRRWSKQDGHRRFKATRVQRASASTEGQLHAVPGEDGQVPTREQIQKQRQQLSSRTRMTIFHSGNQYDGSHVRSLASLSSWDKKPNSAPVAARLKDGSTSLLASPSSRHIGPARRRVTPSAS